MDCTNICHNPSIRSEELFLLAGRMGIYLAMEGLRYCLRRLSRHKPFKAQQGLRHHFSLIRKLLDASNAGEILASDKAFIHRRSEERRVGKECNLISNFYYKKT